MDSYTMHRSYVEAARAVGGDAEELAFRRMIDSYALDGVEPEKSSRFWPLFALLKANIDSSAKRRTGGAEGAAKRWGRDEGGRMRDEKRGVKPEAQKIACGIPSADGYPNSHPQSPCKGPSSPAIANRIEENRIEEEVEGECEGKQAGKTSLPASGVKSLGFDREAVKITGVTDGDLERWRRAYPFVDAADELARMAQWLFDNPRRGKKDLRRFAGNWLAEENRRRETRGGSSARGAAAAQDGAARRIGETGGLFV